MSGNISQERENYIKYVVLHKKLGMGWFTFSLFVMINLSYFNNDHFFHKPNLEAWDCALSCKTSQKRKKWHDASCYVWFVWFFSKCFSILINNFICYNLFVKKHVWVLKTVIQWLHLWKQLKYMTSCIKDRSWCEKNLFQKLCWVIMGKFNYDQLFLYKRSLSACIGN